MDGNTITTLLFDCDNTLVLSEELAFEGCAEVANALCRDKEVALAADLTGPALMSEFVGQNFRGMLASLQARHGFSLTAAEADALVRREEDVVIAKLRAALKPCEGADAALERIAAARRPYTRAVVSSSALRRVRASLETVGQDRFFAPEHVFSAASSLDPPSSKPDPAVYLHALATLDRRAGECVAVEDSRSGTLSAARAGIPVLGYVGPYPEGQKQEMARRLTESGAVVIMGHWDELEEKLAEIERLSRPLRG